MYLEASSGLYLNSLKSHFTITATGKFRQFINAHNDRKTGHKCASALCTTILVPSTLTWLDLGGYLFVLSRHQFVGLLESPK